VATDSLYFIIALDVFRTISEAIFGASRLNNRAKAIFRDAVGTAFDVPSGYARYLRQHTKAGDIPSVGLVNSLRCIAPGVLLARRTRAVLAVATLASRESVVSIDLAGKPQPGPGDDSQGVSFGIASRQVDEAATFFRLLDAVLRSVHNLNPWLYTAGRFFESNRTEMCSDGSEQIAHHGNFARFADRGSGRRYITRFPMDCDARISAAEGRHERASNA
jgi:hypothetical protein